MTVGDIDPKKPKRLADVHQGLKVVWQCLSSKDFIAIAAPNAIADDEAVVDEVGHHALHGALRDSHQSSHFFEQDLGISANAHEDLSVVREETPR